MVGCVYVTLNFKMHLAYEMISTGLLSTATVVGFLEYPQPGGGTHPPIPSEGELGEVLRQLG